MLTRGPRNASRIADPPYLSAHRRIEWVVALLVIVAVVAFGVEAESASAAEAEGTAPELIEPGEAGFEASEPVPDTEAGAAAEDPDAPASAAKGKEPLRIADVRTSPERIFLGARRRAGFGFQLAGSQGRELLVKVVGVDSRKVVRRFRLGRVAGGDRARVSWDGKLPKGGYADEGLYAFRVFSEGDRADITGDSSGGRFGFYGHRFPLLGRHTYGDGFGAGRNHQGQDLFAKCGTREVAARGGRVQTRSYHESAGYYVVVDGRGTGQDYAYMHMARKGRPAEGSWVSTGETLGFASDTGNASGCHLHFELWSAPGWYEGGHAKPPTRPLQRWDRWS